MMLKSGNRPLISSFDGFLLICLIFISQLKLHLGIYSSVHSINIVEVLLLYDHFFSFLYPKMVIYFTHPVVNF